MFAEPRHDRRRFFGMAALSLGAAWIGTRDSVLQMITVKPFRLSSASDLASLGRATAWLNSAPLTAGDLKGKVVLVDFWTYTCIVRQSGSIADRQFEIEFLDCGVEAFAFTFG